MSRGSTTNCARSDSTRFHSSAATPFWRCAFRFWNESIMSATSAPSGRVPPGKVRSGIWMSCRFSPEHSKTLQFKKAAVRSDLTPSRMARVRTSTWGAIVAMARRPIPFSPKIGLAWPPCMGRRRLRSTLDSVAMVSQQSTNSSSSMPNPSSLSTNRPLLR